MQQSIAVRAAGVMLALLAPGVALAQSRAFDLPSQPAQTAIPEFARQAHRQIIAPAEQLRAVTTPAIRGVATVHDALTRLIAGTGLEIAGDDGAVITLRRRRPAVISEAPIRGEKPVDEGEPLMSTAEVDPLVVLGVGQSRQVERIEGPRQRWDPPGSGPLRSLDRLPSVNFSSADAFGANEASTRVSVRGFGQGRLGFTLDDVPLGDLTYGNFDGLNVSRAISSENVRSVELTQGPGAIETASTTNLGGAVQFTSIDPSTEAGADVDLSVGSARARRTFARLRSGAIDGGPRGYVSYVDSRTDKWQSGRGPQSLQQLNFKLFQPLAGGDLAGFVNLSRRRDSNPMDLSLAMLSRLGDRWDTLSPNWSLAVQIADIAREGGRLATPAMNPYAGMRFPAPISSVNDAVYNLTSLRDDALSGLTYRSSVGERLELKATAYGHWDHGADMVWTPFQPSPNYGTPGSQTDNAPISIQSTEHDSRRQGVLTSAIARLGDHTVSGGLWLEAIDLREARRFYALNADRPQRDGLRFQDNPFLTDWVYRFETLTAQFHLLDTWSLNDALTVNGGFKALSVTDTVATRFGPEKAGRIRARNPFLPEVGVRYRLDVGTELFADYARGMRAFTASSTSGPFAASSAAFRAIAPTLRPELSDGVEVGLRHSTARALLTVALYDTRFRDRLFATPLAAGPAAGSMALANVGGVSTYGLELAGSWRPSENWTAFGSYALNRAAYDQDVLDRAGQLIARTAGKRPVDAPEQMAKVNLAYDQGGLFVRLGVSFVSRRYFTFENDQSVPGHFLTDLTAGYRFSGSPWLEGLEAQLNVTNLLDLHYVATVGSRDFPIRGDAQTLLPGAPRQAFMTLRKSF